MKCCSLSPPPKKFTSPTRHKTRRCALLLFANHAGLGLASRCMQYGPSTASERSANASGSVVCAFGGGEPRSECVCLKKPRRVSASPRFIRPPIDYNIYHQQGDSIFV
ncbi:hypothetical protein K437DRAFT_124274 [Tilletiaria anomala UBC 951]|uniref:Uncharacterized protein n=1 Tax=Tilletiaria anomala (strain ATCC 24038 / CBS 436.72 / UBC 951) TaxID=1037660 RepID=A0A066W389_TILAU|nr:uncharacterized protein K437DRAFT_124274 [Tilletiaria anomala UBC 951]KDN45245.1 hypothetical protein K437DRAFT_124274 [Tilletiaria anomala UBC 951]